MNHCKKQEPAGWYVFFWIVCAMVLITAASVEAWAQRSYELARANTEMELSRLRASVRASSSDAGKIRSAESDLSDMSRRRLDAIERRGQ